MCIRDRDYAGLAPNVDKKEPLERDEFIHSLIDIQYDRNDYDLARGTFRVRGCLLYTSRGEVKLGSEPERKRVRNGRFQSRAADAKPGELSLGLSLIHICFTPNESG